MDKAKETTAPNKSQADSDEYDSDDYNSDDSFIANDEDSEEGSSPDRKFTPDKRRPAKKGKKPWVLSKEDVAGARENIQGKMRNRRLKKMKDKTREKVKDDFVDYDDEGGDGDGGKGNPGEENADRFIGEQFDRGLGENQDLLENIFNDDMFAEVTDKPQDAEEGTQLTEDFSKMLPPEEQQKYFLTEMDRQIKKKDIPERLQIRFEGRLEIVPEEMVHESRWIVKKLILKNNLSDKMHGALEIKVYGVLENLLWKNQEIMFIWMYSRQNITTNLHSAPRTETHYELTLEDLWFIYFADEEWQKCSELRMSLTKLMQLLEKYEELRGLAKMAIEGAMDMANLTSCYQFLKFRLKSYIDEEQIEDLLEGKLATEKGYKKMKRMKKPNRMKEMHEYGLHKVAYQIAVTPEQLADNFEENKQVNTPTLLRQRPNELSEEVSKENVGYLSRPVDTLTAICKMIAADYFYHPVIRAHLKQICSEKLYVVTKPTAKGKKTLNVYHYYYPAKRITGKRVSSIEPFLWMLVVEAESKGLVKVQFVMDHDRDPDWTSLMRKVKRLLLDEREPKSKNEKSLMDSWNQVRASVADNLVKLYVKPVFEKEFRKQLTRMGKQRIVMDIKREFKQIINIKPYRPTLQGEEDPEELPTGISNKMLGLESVRVLACTMTSSLTTSSRDLEAVFVALNEKGEIDGILRLRNCFRKSLGMKNISKQTQYDNNIKNLKDFVIKQLPKVIVISPKSLVMQGLKIELNDLFTEIFDNLGNELMKPFVMWGDNRVAEIASRSESSKKYIDSTDETVREAVSLGRYVQDPLAETMNLWSHRPKENLVLKMALHPMQHLIPLKELHQQLESVVLEIVGEAGVNVNRCFKIDHRASPLQFVSGLGPRKSEKFIQSLKSTIKEGYVGNREDLEGCGLLSSNTYIFCIGFLRFYRENLRRDEMLAHKDLNLLDLTRIHPDNYSMANKMVLECLQVDFGRDDTKKNHNSEVLKVMLDPEKLQELDLVDYGEHLSQKRNSNMHWQIQFIEKELAQPFLDPREDFRTNINMVELFYKLTNENKHVVYENALVLMQIKGFDSKGLKLSTNNGVQAIISQEDLGYQLGDNEVSDQQILARFPVNSHSHVRIRKIDYIRLRLNVSLREQDLTAHKDFLRNSKILERWGLSDDSFKVYKDEDYPLLSGKDRQKFRLTQRFIPRKIRHPHFKNMPLANAQDHLKSRPQGEFVIRPSSQGTSCLNITWKIFPKVFCHLLVKEGHKAENEVISQQLFLAKEKEPFRSLDDIIESFLKPVNLLVRTLVNNSKFLFDSITKVKDRVKEIKKKQPNNIPYFFSSNQDYPQYLVLTYILHRLKVVHELIKLKPDGFIFHEQKFFSIEDLISFFKKNLKTAEYSKFVEKNVSPIFGKKRSQREMIGGRGDGVKLDDRHGVKLENNDRDRDRDRDRDHRSKHRSRHPRKHSDSSDSPEYNERKHRSRTRDYDRFQRPKQEDRDRDRDRGYMKREERQRPRPPGGVKQEDGYGNRSNYMANPQYDMSNYSQGYNSQYKRVKQPEQFVPSNMPYISNYPNTFMPQGNYPPTPMNMPFMPSQFQQSEMSMANYTHNLNMLSANMNPFGNIPPPPPQHPMPDYLKGGMPMPGGTLQGNPQQNNSNRNVTSQNSMVKKEDS